jgi:hypothetical protein
MSKNNPQAPTVAAITIPGLLCADDLALTSFTLNGLQKAINQVTTHCTNWDLKCKQTENTRV